MLVLVQALVLLPRPVQWPFEFKLKINISVLCPMNVEERTIIIYIRTEMSILIYQYIYRFLNDSLVDRFQGL